MYDELLQNRAFQGSEQNGQPSTDRTLRYWHTSGDDTLTLDNSSPFLSNALPWNMRVDIHSGALPVNPTQALITDLNLAYRFNMFYNAIKPLYLEAAWKPSPLQLA
jgi:hypothetical protein